MTSNIKKQQEFFNYLLLKFQNKKCADCKSPDPSWASVSLGIFICHECAGKHRSLGSNKSIVKSIIINDWTIEDLRRMFVGGNSGCVVDNKPFCEKYANYEKYKSIIDKRVEKNKLDFPEDTFMDEIYKKTYVPFTGIIEKKNVEKFSETLPSNENNITNKSKVTTNIQSPIETTIKKQVTENIQLRRQKINIAELKKTIPLNRSPFTIYSSDNDSE